MTRIELEENEARGRFVVYEDEKPVGEMTYIWAGDKLIIIDHTEVKEAFGGKGYGKQLVAEAVAFARERNIKILPLCPFARRVFDKEDAFILNKKRIANYIRENLELEASPTQTYIVLYHQRNHELLSGTIP